MKTVIVVAPADDLHGLAVRERILQLDAGVACVFFDPATFPIASAFHWEFGLDASELTAELAGPLTTNLSPRVGEWLATRGPVSRESVAHSEIAAVWWRRARANVLHPEVSAPELKPVCGRLVAEAMHAFFASCPVHNHVWREEEACGKPYQLWLARRCGLRIPRTLITTDPGRVHAFRHEVAGRGGEVVYKHAGEGSGFGIPTRTLTDDDLGRIDSLKYAPTIFQELVTGRDLRVAVVGTRVLACEWKASSPAARVDIRMDPASRMQPVERPPGLDELLLRFHRAAGLTFGIYDFKLPADGIPVFLEVNPSGQWLDLELEGGEPVSEAWARFLALGPGHEHATHLPVFNRDELRQVARDMIDPELPTQWNRII